jgi:uncharacterized protein (TIGR03382 family)
MPFLLSAALAGTAYLQLDNLTDGGNATLQGGFIAGECWMSVFPASTMGTYTPVGVDVLVGGANSNSLFIVEVYQSTDTFKVGTRIDDEAFYLTATDEGTMNRLRFDEAEMTLPPMTGNIGVAVCFDEHDYWPGPAHDVGINSGNKQKIYADIGTGEDEWWNNSDVGINGDWVMRLCIEGDDVSGTECPEWEGGDADTDADTDSDTDADTDSDTDLDDSGFGFGIIAITPDLAAEGEAIDVVITGQGFDYDAEARIGGINLVGQERLGAETITGRSPSSLPPGVHDVEVIRGDGSSDVLVGAFEVGGGCGCSGTGLAGGWVLMLLAPLLARRRT